MPTVSVVKSQLYKELGKEYSDEEFNELCFKFGIEVDDIVEDPEKGSTLKIEVGANRYDLLCLEGISLALNIFLGRQQLPKYTLSSGCNKPENRMIVKPATAEVRPYVVAAIMRGMTISQDVYNSFIDLQEKLHQNIARKRTLVAIGVHDLSTIKGPITYDAKPPSTISFIPLNRTKEITSDKLLEELSQDLHLREYVHIIKDKPVYPVITDNNGVVLSLPPIINGNHTKISTKTKDVFIECTGTDAFRLQVVLDQLVCMFSKYCKNPYNIEPVMVEYVNKEPEQFPKLETRTELITKDMCNIYGGVNESEQSICNYLNKMAVSASVEGNKIKVVVPPIRYDILHEVDIVDDFCVSYGFDRLAEDMKVHPAPTVGEELEINYLSDKIRLLLSQNNFTEAATFTLCSQSDIGSKLRLNIDKIPYVKVGNPKTVDCEAVRTTLLPGLLRTACSNKHVALPIKLFEVADVVVKDSDKKSTKGVGARNERHLCALNYNATHGMEFLHGLLDLVMHACKIPFSQRDGYYLKNGDHPTYIPGLCGVVLIGEEEVGRIGVIHPEVILNFELSYPASALSLNLERIFPYSRL